MTFQKTTATEQELKLWNKTAQLLGPTWADHLFREFGSDYMKAISKRVLHDEALFGIQPPRDKIFRAYTATPYDKVKVVILGQDPYPTPGNANGLAFSYGTANGDMEFRIPGSLRNIFKEIENTEGFQMYHESDLTRWANQGVLLLNTSLTTISGQAGGHSGIGWDKFILKTIKALNLKPRPVIYLMWGNHAKSFMPVVSSNHECLVAPHPSPLSAHRGFFGCGHFKHCNVILKMAGYTPIDWLN